MLLSEMQGQRLGMIGFLTPCFVTLQPSAHAKKGSQGQEALKPYVKDVEWHDKDWRDHIVDNHE